jgi:hypothetical protein
MTPLQSTGLVLVVSASIGFVLASALLPATAPTRMGALCFWLARLLLAASLAAIGLGALEIANTSLEGDPSFDADDVDRALLARAFTDVLYAGTLAGWATVVQVIGMSSFAWRQSQTADDEPEPTDELAVDTQ